MTAVIPLGTFSQVLLRDAWPTEDGNFTPWLAEPGNIALLGSALNMVLEVEAVEHWVGPFRADILARVEDAGELDHRAVIENQFGRTDHNHLGQILTYLAGIENARTVVWIAEKIQEDHRAAVDWLNANTTDDFSFFAIEIELWRIGSSPPAPRFNVIASPNDWTRSTRSATREITDTNRTARQQSRLAYWASFAEFLSARHSMFSVTPGINKSRYGFPVGQTLFRIFAMIGLNRKMAMVGLSIPNSPDKSLFNLLLAQKEAVEREFGEPLDWLERSANKRPWVALYRRQVDPSDPSQYGDLHMWMHDGMERFQRVFAPRIATLSSTAALDTDDAGDADD